MSTISGWNDGGAYSVLTVKSSVSSRFIPITPKKRKLEKYVHNRNNAVRGTASTDKKTVLGGVRDRGIVGKRSVSTKKSGNLFGRLRGVPWISIRQGW